MTMMRRNRRSFWPAELTWPDERLDRVMRDMLQDFFTDGSLSERAKETFANPMRVEEFIDDGQCVVRAELPGLDPDKDIEITVSDGTLRLRAHREERKVEDRPDSYRSEFRYGSLHRSIRLPEGTTESDVHASYSDGILEVRVRMAESQPPTKIEIKHG